jgi:EEF1A lysine methyltransferase 4
MASDENVALSRAEYWDERYSKSDGDNPTHEWFRSYSALEPFFAKHLFPVWAPESAPKLVHLGSGDSVSETEFYKLNSAS